VTAHDPNSPDPEPDDPEPDERNDQPVEGPVEGKDVEEFFQRLPGSFRWPKPNADAVAAAVDAIQRMSGSAAAQDLAAAGAADQPGNACSECGGSLPAGAHFCVWCGIPKDPAAPDAAAPLHSRAGAQHHVHHHYHHLVPSQGMASGAPSAESQSSGPRGRAPGSAGGSVGKSTGSRAEAGARQVVQDWAQACNTKHIDDLLELYAADATLIRSSIPPVRSLPAIREFLVSLLEAGLGDVEMESLRVEVMGEIALDLGRCKMLVPVTMGKRREERGKYLIVLVRQPTGTWKILADCWSADLAVSAPTLETAARKGSEPIPPLGKPR
jgi:ketosteroid isomerase-like protein